MLGGMKLPAKMPDWWPKPGYWWARNPLGVVRETLVLMHHDYPPVVWQMNEAGEWVSMKEL